MNIRSIQNQYFQTYCFHFTKLEKKIFNILKRWRLNIKINIALKIVHNNTTNNNKRQILAMNIIKKILNNKILAIYKLGNHQPNFITLSQNL